MSIFSLVIIISVAVFCCIWFFEIARAVILLANFLVSILTKQKK